MQYTVHCHSLAKTSSEGKLVVKLMAVDVKFMSQRVSKVPVLMEVSKIRSMPYHCTFHAVDKSYHYLNILVIVRKVDRAALSNMGMEGKRKYDRPIER